MSARTTSLASLLLVATVFMIATSSIGTQCYNEHPDYKTQKITNFNFMVVNIVCAVLSATSAIGVLVMAARAPPAAMIVST
jgi:hypothetical protein